jgi:hypothetical protein
VGFALLGMVASALATWVVAHIYYRRSLAAAKRMDPTVQLSALAEEVRDINRRIRSSAGLTADELSHLEGAMGQLLDHIAVAENSTEDLLIALEYYVLALRELERPGKIQTPEHMIERIGSVVRLIRSCLSRDVGGAHTRAANLLKQLKAPRSGTPH